MLIYKIRLRAAPAWGHPPLSIPKWHYKRKRVPPDPSNGSTAIAIGPPRSSRRERI